MGKEQEKVSSCLKLGREGGTKPKKENTEHEEDKEREAGREEGEESKASAE